MLRQLRIKNRGRRWPVDCDDDGTDTTPKEFWTTFVRNPVHAQPAGTVWDGRRQCKGKETVRRVDSRAMKLPYLFRRMIARVIGSSRDFCVFANSPAQGGGVREVGIEVYDSGRLPPENVRAALDRHAGKLRSRVMLSRMRRHGGMLLTVMDGPILHGYGWVQTWRPVKREFWWLADNAICLGPYWTHPDLRGRGIYGRLLSRSLFECRRRGWDALYIWSGVDNAPSIRGIEKAGFRSLGRHRVSTYLFGRVRRHEVVEGPPHRGGG